MTEQVEQTRKSMMDGSAWVRGFFMLLFAFIYQLAEMVLVFICIFQFLIKLFSGDVNERLQDFGDDVSRFLFQILQFETFNTEYRPFPFNPWPGHEAQFEEIEDEARSDQ